MIRRSTILVLGAMAIALIAVVLVGLRVLDRDRTEIHDRFGQEKRQGLEEAARAFSADVAEIGEDFDLAATLIADAESSDVAARELHAIATIKREYLMVEARGTDDRGARVVALDAPPGIEAIAAEQLVRSLAIAQDHPGKLHVSEPLIGSTDRSRWYRVFSRRHPDRQHAVAAVVDTAVLLDRLKVGRDGSSAVLVLGSDDRVAPLSNARLATLATFHRSLRGLIDATRSGTSASATLTAAESKQLGLPNTEAVGVAVSLPLADGQPAVLLAVSSAAALQAQHQFIVKRALVLGGLVVLLMLAAAAYVTHNARRAAVLRERLRHLTEQRRIEDQIVRNEKLITAGQLAAGIAHEIGTPLSIARGRAELLKLPPTDDNRRVIIEQIDRVTRLIQQLLDYVRPQGGVVQSVDLHGAMTSAVHLLGPEATKRKVALEVDAPQGLGTLRADPDRIEQILVNLMMNAIDACETGGRVVLDAKAADGDMVLQVSDTGQGIPPELQAQVFDPFFTTKKRGQGTGLGLWVVAQLVRSHDGTIEVDSSPNVGTTVRIRWPMS